ASHSSAPSRRSSASDNSRVMSLHFPMNVPAGKPFFGQAGAQSQAGAIDQHAAVIRGHFKLAANFRGLQIEKLAHHEDASNLLGQKLETHLEQRPELLLTQRGLGRRPRPRLRFAGPMSVVLEQFAIE